MAADARKSQAWERIELEYFNKPETVELWQDLETLQKFCDKIKKELSVDLLTLKSVFILFLVTEDHSWIFEIDRKNPQYFSQIYLSREDLGFLFRRMNEKRKIRHV